MREVEVAQEPQNIFEMESAELKSLCVLSEISISTGITEVWGPGMTFFASSDRYICRIRSVVGSSAFQPRFGHVGIPYTGRER